MIVFHLEGKKRPVLKTKLLLLTLLTCFLFLPFVMLATTLYAQNTRMSLEVNSSTVKNVLKMIEEKSEFRFFYNSDLVDLDKVVNESFKNSTIDEILRFVLAETSVGYRVLDNNFVVLSSKEVLQQITVTGKVTDELGDPLPGVTVSIKGTTQGTATDANGAYSLAVPNANATLAFSYIGFVTSEFTVGNQRTIDVVLFEDTRKIEEIVVVGYGTQKKVNLTGAVSSVTSEVLENRPIASTGQGLQGLIPNLNVTMTDGDPSNPSTYNIRGFESINTTGGPLILVDGTPMDIDLINPNDIASVVVLKDASASSIYGARAAFGVILVSTKQGTSGKARVSFSTEQSMSRPINFFDPVYDPYVFKTWYNKANLRTNGVVAYNEDTMEKTKRWVENPTDANAWEVDNGNLRYFGSNDFMNKVITKYAPQQKYDMNISKSTEDASYYISFGYLNKDGYINDKEKNEHYKRFNVLMKSDIKINPWFRLDNKITFNDEIQERPNRMESWNDINFNTVVRTSPIIPLEFPDLPYYLEPGDHDQFAQYIGMPFEANSNILPFLRSGGRMKYNKGDLYLNQGVTLQILEGLKFRGDFTYHTSFRNYQGYVLEIKVPTTNLLAEEFLVTHRSTPQSYIENQNNYRQDYQFNAYLEYEVNNIKDHYLKAMIGFNQEWGKYEYNRARANDVINTTIIDIQATSGLQQTGGSSQELALRGLFYRLNYIFKDKYLVELSGRYDGTSRFPKNSRFGFFPSASIGWRISEESFMKSTRSWLDNLKLRASYGVLGNQALGGNYYPYITSMALSSVYYMMDANRTLMPNIGVPNLVASTLTWESVASRNLGVDITLLKQRLDVSFDVYTRETKDMLMRITYPDILGATAPQENGADLRTKGWELAVSWRDKIGKDWWYNVTLSLWDNQSEITKYFNPSGAIATNVSGGLTTWYEGQKTGEIWGYVTEGIFQSDEEVDTHADQSALGTDWRAGDIKYADLNNDGRVTSGGNTLSDPGDRKILGNTTARYSFGFFPKVSYKNWSLDVFFQGVMKKDFMPSASAEYGFFPFKMPNGYMEKYYMTETWSEENRNAYFAGPHISANNHKNTQNQSRYLQNAAYIRLKTLTLSYRFPTPWMTKIGISGAQVYLAGLNLWEYTQMHKPLDPESTSDIVPYPRQRNYSIGIKVQL